MELAAEVGTMSRPSDSPRIRSSSSSLRSPVSRVDAPDLIDAVGLAGEQEPALPENGAR